MTSLILRNRGIEFINPEQLILAAAEAVHPNAGVAAAGVTAGGVTQIDLHGNKLRGGHHAHGQLDRLLEFTALASLDLSTNPLGVVPPLLPRLRCLTRLSLSSCGITDLDLGALPRLMDLDVSDNCVVDLAGLALCLNLRCLNLKRNSVESLSGLAHLRKLDSLDVSLNILPNPAALELLRANTRLQYLKVDGNPAACYACCRRHLCTQIAPALCMLDGVGVGAAAGVGVEDRVVVGRAAAALGSATLAEAGDGAMGGAAAPTVAMGTSVPMDVAATVAAGHADASSPLRGAKGDAEGGAGGDTAVRGAVGVCAAVRSVPAVAAVAVVVASGRATTNTTGTAASCELGAVVGEAIGTASRKAVPATDVADATPSKPLRTSFLHCALCDREAPEDVIDIPIPSVRVPKPEPVLDPVPAPEVVVKPPPPVAEVRPPAQAPPRPPPRRPAKKQQQGTRRTFLGRKVKRTEAKQQAQLQRPSPVSPKKLDENTTGPMPFISDYSGMSMRQSRNSMPFKPLGRSTKAGTAFSTEFLRRCAQLKGGQGMRQARQIGRGGGLDKIW